MLTWHAPTPPWPPAKPATQPCRRSPPPPRPQRIVRLGGPVDDDMANLIVAQLLYLDSADPNRDVTLYINSPGGSVTAGKRGATCSRGRALGVRAAAPPACGVLARAPPGGSATRPAVRA